MKTIVTMLAALACGSASLIVICVRAIALDEPKAQGVAAEAKRKLARIESKVLWVQPVAPGLLTTEDADAIARECPAVKHAAPVIRARCQLVHGQQTWVPIYVIGTTPAYLDVRDRRKLAVGDSFTDQDVRGGKRVCLVGQTIVHELLHDASPLGKSLQVHGAAFRVIGVLRSKGANSMDIDDDDIVVAPWAALESITRAARGDSAKKETLNALDQLYPGDRVPDQRRPKPSGNVDQILMRVGSVDDVRAAGRQVADLLHLRHHIAAGKRHDFLLRDRLEEWKALKSAAGE
jgi:hypothetical protein